MLDYDLGDVPGEDLIEALTVLVKRDHQLTVDLLAHMGEVDARHLYLLEACSNMFTYCVSRLNMGESKSYKRIVAARAARRYPAIYGYVASGDLHLSGLTLLARRLTPENHHELLEAARRLSKRGIERLLAERFPSPDVETSLRKLPERRPPAHLVAASAADVPAQETLAAMTTPSSPSTSKPSPSTSALSEPLTAPSPSANQASLNSVPPGIWAPAEVKPLSTARYLLKLTMPSAMRDKLLEAQALMRHRLPGGELDMVIDRALDALLRELGHSKFGETDKPRKKVRPPKEGSRYIPTSVKREVATRDEHRCTFVDAQGRRCEERAFLEFDHIQPVGRGGTAKRADEVRLLCRAHNRHAAEQVFGKEFMERKIAEARQRRAARAAASRPGTREAEHTTQRPAERPVPRRKPPAKADKPASKKPKRTGHGHRTIPPPRGRRKVVDSA